jgi:hypothetical protein
MKHDPRTLTPLLAGLSFDGPVEPFLVFADWLQSLGDPWGELIAIQCALGWSSDRWDVQEQLLREHGARWFPLYGQLGRIVLWSRGFVRRVTYREPPSHKQMVSELTRLFDLPAGRLCNELSFANAFLSDAHGRELLRLRKRLRTLEHFDLTGNRFTPDVAADLARTFPNANLGRS